MTKKLSISIGISAYNEESNIGKLITNLLEQNLDGIILKEILVISDGSTDRTSLIVRSFKDKRIRLTSHKVRIGKIYGLSEIVGQATGDILIALDADVLLVSKYFLRNISKSFIKNKKVGLVGADTVSIEARSFFEKVIASSHRFKNQMYKKMNKGNNLFLCHGRGLAFSKKFYEKIEFVSDYPTDAQTYLFCVTKGFLFKFEPRAKVLFRSPSTLKDHNKQHSRFVAGKKSFEKMFNHELVKKEYLIPLELKINHIVRYFISSPIDMISYSIIYSYLKIFNPAVESYKAKWEISSTTKKVTS